MNAPETKYSSEYVEIKTSLEHIRTKLESIESFVHDIHKTNTELTGQVGKNRVEIASVKATAAIVGGLAGTILAIFLRFLFTG